MNPLEGERLMIPIEAGREELERPRGFNSGEQKSPPMITTGVLPF